MWQTRMDQGCHAGTSLRTGHACLALLWTVFRLVLRCAVVGLQDVDVIDLLFRSSEVSSQLMMGAKWLVCHR